MAGAAIGHGNQLNRPADGRQALQQAAATEHFIVRMRGNDDCTMPFGYQLFDADVRQFGHVRRGLPLMQWRALAYDRIGFHNCHLPLGCSATCSPNAARSRSAWLWRTYTGRSAINWSKCGSLQ